MLGPCITRIVAGVHNAWTVSRSAEALTLYIRAHHLCDSGTEHILSMAASSSTSSPVPPLPADLAPDVTKTNDPGVQYPELPHISSRLGCMVYSHKGVYGTIYTKGQEYLEEPKDNERLTFVGAAALQLCVGLHLYDKYPLKVVGFLTVRGSLLAFAYMQHADKQGAEVARRASEQ